MFITLWWNGGDIRVSANAMISPHYLDQATRLVRLFNNLTEHMTQSGQGMEIGMLADTL